MLTAPLAATGTGPAHASSAVAPGSVKIAPNSVNIGLLPFKVMTGGVRSRTITAFVEKAALLEASLTVITTMLVPSSNGALLVGVWEIVSAPDKSVARMKLVPVTFGIRALQFVSAASVKLVKLHKMVAGVVSRTMTVRAAVLVFPFPSLAV